MLLKNFPLILPTDGAIESPMFFKALQPLCHSLSLSEMIALFFCRKWKEVSRLMLYFSLLVCSQVYIFQLPPVKESIHGDKNSFHL